MESSKNAGGYEKPPREKTPQSVEEANKIFQLREELQNRLKQTRADDVTSKEDRKKQFEPTTQGLDEIEKTVKETGEDLSKKLNLITINRHFEPMASSSPIMKQLSDKDEEEEDKNVKAIIDKSQRLGMIIGSLPEKYLPLSDNKFGIWYHESGFHIGGNKVIIDGDDLVIDDEKYKGTQGLWRLLTNPNEKKIYHETYNTWWIKKGNFTENDLSLYKDILKKTRSIYQNNDPSTKNTKV